MGRTGGTLVCRRHIPRGDMACGPWWCPTPRCRHWVSQRWRQVQPCRTAALWAGMWGWLPARSACMCVPTPPIRPRAAAVALHVMPPPGSGPRHHGLVIVTDMWHIEQLLLQRANGVWCGGGDCPCCIQSTVLVVPVCPAGPTQRRPHTVRSGPYIHISCVARLGRNTGDGTGLAAWQASASRHVARHTARACAPAGTPQVGMHQGYTSPQLPPPARESRGAVTPHPRIGSTRAHTISAWLGARTHIGVGAGCLQHTWNVKPRARHPPTHTPSLVCSA